MLKRLTDIMDLEIVYSAVPGAAAFTTGVIDLAGYEMAEFELAAGTTGETAVAASVLECDTTNGTFAGVTGSTFELQDTCTGGAVYMAEIPVNDRYAVVKVTSTPTAAVHYTVTARKHNKRELPA